MDYAMVPRARSLLHTVSRSPLIDVWFFLPDQDIRFCGDYSTDCIFGTAGMRESNRIRDLASLNSPARLPGKTEMDI